MTKTLVQERCGIDLDANRERFLFCGDSPNDEPLFQYFPCSAGVQNVLRFADRMKSLPSFVASREGGEGFAEIVETIVQRRATWGIDKTYQVSWPVDCTPWKAQEKMEVMNGLKGKINIITLIKTYGTLYSEALWINFESHSEQELFKWFLASILFGKRISEKIAIKTYNEFVKNSLTTPDKILETGWDGLVRILNDGGYVRYDFSTATRLLDIAKTLKEKYGGLIEVYKAASDARNIERKLLSNGEEYV